MSAGQRRPASDGRRRPRATQVALLALLFAALAAAPAAAQSPALLLQATPATFQPNASIAINAEVSLNGSIESFCPSSAWPPCVVLSVHTSAQVTRPGGFSTFNAAWNDWVTLQASDPGPGQSMQPTTYTLTGTVVVTYCEWDIFLGDCATPPQQYVEWGQTQATVYPVSFPSADTVSPSSGSGLSQTFTLTYSSAAGAGDITYMQLWIGGHGSQPCSVQYHAPSQSLALFLHGSGWISAPLGHPSGLQNAECALHTGTATAIAAGTQWTLGVPLTFDAGWTGAREVWMIAWSQSGVDSGWQHRGNWTVPCTAQVTPTAVQLGATSGQTSFSIDTPAGCSWIATSSDFMTVAPPSSGTGPAQVHYAYSANPGSQARVAYPVIAGQMVTVTQAGTPPPTETISYFHLDAIGSVRAVTDGGGNVVSRHDYLPFGQEWQPPASNLRVRFTGQERDQETGLDYFGARYYLAQIERFTQPDPLALTPERALRPSRLNRYAYANSNPLRFIDPDGLDSCEFFGMKVTCTTESNARGWSREDLEHAIWRARVWVERETQPVRDAFAEVGDGIGRFRELVQDAKSKACSSIGPAISVGLGLGGTVGLGSDLLKPYLDGYFPTFISGGAVAKLNLQGQLMLSVQLNMMMEGHGAYVGGGFLANASVEPLAHPRGWSPSATAGYIEAGAGWGPSYTAGATVAGGQDGAALGVDMSAFRRFGGGYGGYSAQGVAISKTYATGGILCQ